MAAPFARHFQAARGRESLEACETCRIGSESCRETPVRNETRMRKMVAVGLGQGIPPPQANGYIDYLAAVDLGKCRKIFVKLFCAPCHNTVDGPFTHTGNAP
jgi:hypothetical protein